MATRVIQWLQKLKVSEGPRAGGSGDRSRRRETAPPLGTHRLGAGPAIGRSPAASRRCRAPSGVRLNRCQAAPLEPL